jgi:predicted ATPase
MGMVLIEFDRLDEAHDVITEALATIDETSSRFYLSEALRLKGELCLRRMRNASEAEQFFNEGLAVAREPEQSCRGFELRLLMSVVRLDDFIGRASRESRQELQAALNLYDEGLGTSDLIEARKLLELQPA